MAEDGGHLGPLQTEEVVVQGSADQKQDRSGQENLCVLGLHANQSVQLLQLCLHREESGLRSALQPASNLVPLGGVDPRENVLQQ